MNVQLTHNVSGATKTGKIGFSWTSLFFGALVPLIRGDFIWFVVYLFATGISFGIFWIIFPFIYNRIYTKKLLESGYIPANESARQVLVQKGLISATAPQSIRQPQAQPQQPQQTNATPKAPPSSAQVDNSNLKKLIDDYVGSKSGHKNSFTHDNIPQDLLPKIAKKFPPCNPNSENILFAGVYGTMAIYGVVITDKNLYWRFAKGMLATTKTGLIPLNTINSIQAEHTMLHGSYGGGNPGPEFTVNGECIGYFQTLMTISDEDEELLIGLINEINKSGVLLEGRS